MRVGFAGLGAMGAPMAHNLITAGFTLTVHSRRRESAEPLLARGAAWASTPLELARHSDIALTSLPDPASVDAVMDGESGLLAGLRQGSCFVDLSTNAPASVRSLSQRLEARGIGMLDAPVSGGPKGAASGKLAIWASGSLVAFETSRAVLEAMGDQVRFLGEIGNATVAKLVHNCANYTINLVLAEVFTLGVKAGVPPLELFATVRQGSIGRQSIVDRLADHFLPARFETPSFALNLAHKDVALATGLARDVGVPMRLANLAFAEMTEALNRGWGANDSRSAMKLQTERAGVEIEVPQESLRALIKNEPLDRR